MRLVRQSVEYADEALPKPFTLHAAQRAEAKLISEFARMIPETYFEKLVQVHLTNKIKKDAEHQDMLFHQIVLEYANGAEPWHDVHPAVQKLKSFQELLRNERSRLAPES
jgi:hypothetical protein